MTSDARGAARLSRGESAAAELIAIAEAAAPGDRLGSKEELRARCAVSVGTFNEALRIAQSRGVVLVRPGPGGGVFAAAQSPMVRLGNSVLALDGDQTIGGGGDPHPRRARRAADRGRALARVARRHRRDAGDTGRDGRGRPPGSTPSGSCRPTGRCTPASPPSAPTRCSARSTSTCSTRSSPTRWTCCRTEPSRSPRTWPNRHALHAAIIDAIEDRDRDRALSLAADHNTSNPPPATLHSGQAPPRPRTGH